MSNKDIPTVCFVIDASIARAAGPPDAKHPTGAACREFLQRIRGICHRVAMNAALKAEWEKHQSKFALHWYTSMVALRKVRFVSDEPNEALRETIATSSTDAGVVTVMEKDAHLVEVALQSDSRIAALDATVRRHFARLSRDCEVLQPLIWLDPTAEVERATEWLEAGAPVERSRCLHSYPLS